MQQISQFQFQSHSGPGLRTLNTGQRGSCLTLFSETKRSQALLGESSLIRRNRRAPSRQFVSLRPTLISWSAFLILPRNHSAVQSSFKGSGTPFRLPRLLGGGALNRLVRVRGIYLAYWRQTVSHNCDALTALKTRQLRWNGATKIPAISSVHISLWDSMLLQSGASLTCWWFSV